MDDRDDDWNPAALKIQRNHTLSRGSLSYQEWLILNRGGEIDSLLQTGQRPGVFSRVLFLKANPHCLQQAASAIRRSGWTDLAIC